MKRFFFTAMICLACALGCMAQDIITTKKGDDILAKIKSTTESDIHYKLFDHQEGPEYTISKSDVLMIRYDNGAKEIFNQESKGGISAPVNGGTSVSTDQKLLYSQKVAKYGRMRTLGTSLTALGGILVIVGVAEISNSSTYSSTTSTSSSNADAGLTSMIVGVYALAAGIPLWIVGSHAHRKYDKKLHGITSHLNVRPAPRGLSLSYRF